MVSGTRRTATARAVAETVTDPELPMLTLADLGVLREVAEHDGAVTVSITPTYTGCPALDAMRDDLVHALHQAGFGNVEVRTVLRPAWSTDWISAAGRRKLAAAGIAPPGGAPRPVTGPIPLDSRPAAAPGAVPALRLRPDPARCRRSAPPRAGRCTAARPARSRSSTSRRSECP